MCTEHRTCLPRVLTIGPLLQSQPWCYPNLDLKKYANASLTKSCAYNEYPNTAPTLMLSLIRLNDCCRMLSVHVEYVHKHERASLVCLQYEEYNSLCPSDILKHNIRIKSLSPPRPPLLSCIVPFEIPPLAELMLPFVLILLYVAVQVHRTRLPHDHDVRVRSGTRYQSDHSQLMSGRGGDFFDGVCDWRGAGF